MSQDGEHGPKDKRWLLIAEHAGLPDNGASARTAADLEAWCAERGIACDVTHLNQFFQPLVPSKMVGRGEFYWRDGQQFPGETNTLKRLFIRTSIKVTVVKRSTKHVHAQITGPPQTLFEGSFAVPRSGHPSVAVGYQFPSSPTRYTVKIPLSEQAWLRLTEYQRPHMHLTADPPPPSEFSVTLYNSMLFSDLVVKVANDSFPTHRNIVAAHSPVFKSMLETPMKESITSTLAITDHSSAAVKAMLEWMYTRRVSAETSRCAQWHLFMELLHLAHKFQIDGLLPLVQKDLVNLMTRHNCLQLLVAGDVLGLPQLCEQVLDLITVPDVLHDLTLLPEFRQFVVDHPSLFKRFMHEAHPTQRAKRLKTASLTKENDAKT